MNVYRGRSLILIFVLTLALGSCDQERSPTPAEQAVASAPTATVEEAATDTPEPVEPMPTDTKALPTATATLELTATMEPRPTEKAVVEVVDACLACHSDKDQLIETAAPEEKVPSESSGVG